MRLLDRFELLENDAALVDRFEQLLEKLRKKLATEMTVNDLEYAALLDGSINIAIQGTPSPLDWGDLLGVELKSNQFYVYTRPDFLSFLLKVGGGVAHEVGDVIRADFDNPQKAARALTKLANLVLDYVKKETHAKRSWNYLLSHFSPFVGPKIRENVEGLVMGHARNYDQLDDIYGYFDCHFNIQDKKRIAELMVPINLRHPNERGRDLYVIFNKEKPDDSVLVLDLSRNNGLKGSGGERIKQAYKSIRPDITCKNLPDHPLAEVACSYGVSINSCGGSKSVVFSHGLSPKAKLSIDNLMKLVSYTLYKAWEK